MVEPPTDLYVVSHKCKDLRFVMELYSKYWTGISERVFSKRFLYFSSIIVQSLKRAINSLLFNFRFFWGFGKHHGLLIDKTYARNRLC